MTTRQPTDEEILATMPREDILALAEALYSINKSRISAGYKPTAEEQKMMDDADRDLPGLLNHQEH